MTNFLTRLVQRNLGAVPSTRPRIMSRFAPDSTPWGEMPSTSETSNRAIEIDTQADTVRTTSKPETLPMHDTVNAQHDPSATDTVPERQTTRSARLATTLKKTIATPALWWKRIRSIGQADHNTPTRHSPIRPAIKTHSPVHDELDEADDLAASASTVEVEAQLPQAPEQLSDTIDTDFDAATAMPGNQSVGRAAHSPSPRSYTPAAVPSSRQTQVEPPVATNNAAEIGMEHHELVADTRRAAASQNLVQTPSAESTRRVTHLEQQHESKDTTKSDLPMQEHKAINPTVGLMDATATEPIGEIAARDFAPQQETPTVEVNIGQIELRAATPPPPVARPRSKRSRPSLSLDDYLNRRRRRQA